MTKFALSSLLIFVMSLLAYAGPEQYSGKEMKQAIVPAPCPEWYGDTEWNVSIWGTYVFSRNNSDRQFASDLDDAELGPNDNSPFVDLSRQNSGDRYLETDHAWGGGVDLKYFFHRYFGLGVEGFALDARRTETDVTIIERMSCSDTTDRRLIGSGLGTFTLRYPFHCSRFAPYVFAGGGAIFGGGERDLLVAHPNLLTATTVHHGSRTKAIGQFGGGLEIRFTRHIGWLNDFSWNVIDGPGNNLGMVRSGLNFAF